MEFDSVATVDNIFFHFPYTTVRKRVIRPNCDMFVSYLCDASHPDGGKLHDSVSPENWRVFTVNTAEGFDARSIGLNEIQLNAGWQSCYLVLGMVNKTCFQKKNTRVLENAVRAAAF